MKKMRIGTLILLAGLAIATTAQAASNLLSDPSFAKAAQLKAHPPKNANVWQRQKMDPWRFYQIKLPSKIQYTTPSGNQPGVATMTGGESFLESAAFDVHAGDTYKVSFQAKGSGKVSAGFLWWQKYDLDHYKMEMAQPHWTHMKKPQAVSKSKWQPVSATFQASKNATRSYLRLVVSDGKVSIRNVKVEKISNGK